MMRIILSFLWLYLIAFQSFSKSYGYAVNDSFFSAKGLIHSDSTSTRDSLIAAAVAKRSADYKWNLYVKPAQGNSFQWISLQQTLKGASGVHVMEPSGEPGTIQSMLVRGASIPVFSAKDLLLTQPLIVLNGVPLISQDHPFAYDIQQYDFNRIGPSSNLLAGIDPEDIASIEVVKDMVEAARYGVRAANGVIKITTKEPSINKRISVSTYTGLATSPGVTTMNGASENAFRKVFYDRYATAQQRLNIPGYLRDSLYSIYYGPSNWTDLYYKNGPEFGLNATLTGGFPNANFRASVGTVRNNGIADNTGLSRYNASFALVTKPTKWMTIGTSINASQLVRNRNRNFRDRYAEVRYLPDLTNPISPNKDYYSNFLDQYDKSFDKNKSNILNGAVDMRLAFGKFGFLTRLAANYSDGYRDVFYPGTLMETNNYVSNYFGFNQRILIENVADYKLDWKDKHHLKLEAGQSVQLDSYRYNYSYAYDGSSDFIKVNALNDPLNPSVNIFGNANTVGFLNTLIVRLIDQTKNNLLSYHTKADYQYKKKYSVSLLLRADGSSNAQVTNQWLFAPAISGSWNLKEEFLKEAEAFSELRLNASAGRLGNVLQDDRFAAGPQYVVDVTYTGEPRLGNYNGAATLERPYSRGWVGYGIPWAYTDQITGGLSAGLFNNRLLAAVDLYSRINKNQMLEVPAYAEYGYATAFKPGMEVQNSGVELQLRADVLAKTSRLKWSPALNLNYNRNKLKALPDGLDKIIIGNRLLKVGESIDQFWLYENEGIFNANSEIPVNPSTNEPLRFQNEALQAGDPRWRDANGDYIIDDNDKVLTGHSMPVVFGSFSNNLGYKKWTLAVDMYYNMGRKILNQEMASRFDFINMQSANNINAVKEITYWEKRGDYNRYPIYNPWSPVSPYRADQDLFLEDASFLKMRSITISYDLKSSLKKAKFNKMIIWGSVRNVFTISQYSGRDPELVDYTGFDTGYGQAIPRTYTLGIKMDL